MAEVTFLPVRKINVNLRTGFHWITPNGSNSNPIMQQQMYDPWTNQMGRAVFAFQTNGFRSAGCNPSSQYPNHSIRTAAPGQHHFFAQNILRNVLIIVISWDWRLHVSLINLCYVAIGGCNLSGFSECCKMMQNVSSLISVSKFHQKHGDFYPWSTLLVLLEQEEYIFIIRMFSKMRGLMW